MSVDALKIQLELEIQKLLASSKTAKSIIDSIQKSAVQMAQSIGTANQTAASKTDKAFSSMERQARRLELAIDQLRSKAELLSNTGIGVSDTGLESLYNSIDRLQNRMKDLREISGEQGIAQGALPFDRLAQKITETRQAIGSLPEDTRAADKAFATMQQQIRQLDTAFDQLQRRISQFAQKGGSQEGVNALNSSFENLSNRLQNLRENADRAGIGARLTPDIQKLTDKAGTAKGALSDLTASTKTSVESVLAMRSAFLQAGAAAAILLLPLKAVIDEIRKSIDVFMTMTQELRSIKVLMGTTAIEASAWAKMARDGGVSATVFERGVIQLEQGLLAMQTAQLEGKESTSSFSRAIETLGIDVTDAQGNLRTASDVMRDVSDRLLGMEDSGARAAAAVQIFGRYNRDLVVTLITAVRTLEESEAAARKFGVTLTTEDVKAMMAMQIATSDLKDAWAGLRSEVGRSASEAFAPLVQILAEAVNGLRKLFLLVSGSAQIFATWIFTNKTWAESLKEVADRTRDQWYGINSLTNAEEEHNIAVQQAALNEDLRAQKIADTISQLKDLESSLRDQMNELAIQAARAWEDMLRQRIRDSIVRALQEAWEEADIAADYLQRQMDIFRDYNRRLEDIRAEQRKKQEGLEKEAAKKREDLERDHQDRLLKIRLKYSDAVEEAVRSNDAVAVLRARRERDREIRDERIRYDREREELEDSLKEKKEKLEEDRRDELAEARKQRDRQLQDAKEAYERQKEELVKSRERERILREMYYRWEEEDLVRSQERQIRDARRHYEQQKRDLQKQLDDLQRINTRGILDAGQAAANSTSAAINMVGAAAVQAARDWSMRFLLASETGLSGSSSSADDYGIIGGRDAGGIDILNRPSMVRVAGSGPEALISIPVPRGTMNIDHHFSPLPITMPGGGSMSSGQIQAIVYQAMKHVAQELLSNSVRR